MEKPNMSYETLFIIDASIADDEIAALVERFKGMIEENGTIQEFSEWGKRRLAYPSTTKSKDIMFWLTTKRRLISERTRSCLQHHRSVIRSMTIRLDDHQ